PIRGRGLLSHLDRWIAAHEQAITLAPNTALHLPDRQPLELRQRDVGRTACGNASRQLLTVPGVNIWQLIHLLLEYGAGVAVQRCLPGVTGVASPKIHVTHDTCYTRLSSSRRAPTYRRAERDWSD